MTTASVQRSPVGTGVPLVVDLDGTLLAGDSLAESMAVLLRNRPWALFWLPLWLAQGIAVLKSNVAQDAQLGAENLRYRDDVLLYLNEERKAGRVLVLATAAHQDIAFAVAGHLKLFDEVVATSGDLNLKGRAKRDALVQRFGERGFDYIGDSRADLPVWSASRTAHVAGSNRKLAELAWGASAERGREFARARPGPSAWIRAMRVRQWVKNVLIFLPLAMAHRFSLAASASLLAAFFGFSFLASGTYILNDLSDLAADRKHPVKQKRPFASGEISITHGAAVGALLIPLGLVIGAALGTVPILYFVVYLVATVAYSGLLKRKPIVDVVVLAFLYTVRILAGGATAHVRVSPWLFQFSVFLFLSLALVKRYSELHRLQREGKGDGRARGYVLGDLALISQAGVGSGLMAGLVLALYVDSPDVQRLYQQPHVLWAVCPIFAYWILRVWLIANRGGMNEDPIVFAFRDRMSYLAGAGILVVAVLASLPRI